MTTRDRAQRLGDRRRGRQVAAQDLAHRGQHAARGPRREHDPRLRDGDPGELAGSGELVGGVHHPEHREHDVGRPVRDREGRHLASDPADPVAGPAGTPLGQRQQRGLEVDADDSPAVLSGDQRGVARAGGHVQHALAGCDRHGLDGGQRGRLEPPGHQREVAGTPRRDAAAAGHHPGIVPGPGAGTRQPAHRPGIEGPVGPGRILPPPLFR